MQLDVLRRRERANDVDDFRKAGALPVMWCMPESARCASEVESHRRTRKISR